MLNKYLALLCYHFTRYKVTAQDHSAHEVLSVLAPAPGNGPHGFILKRHLVEEGGIAPILGMPTTHFHPMWDLTDNISHNSNNFYSKLNYKHSNNLSVPRSQTCGISIGFHKLYFHFTILVPLAQSHITYLPISHKNHP